MPEADLDFSFFKVLTRNDTGQTGGHQGGIVIPKGIAQFFPALQPGDAATVDHDINAELFHGSRRFGNVATRFQLQTWGGTRRGEYRLTRNLRPLLGRANAGDIVIFQRFRGELNRFRLTLVSQETQQHRDINAQTGARRWGPLSRDQVPLTAETLRKAEDKLEDEVEGAFRPFEPEGRAGRRTTVNLLVRDEAFRALVRRNYNTSCAVCGIGFRTPSDIPEVHASHIIPVNQRGSHDPRNGICLCRTHHWTFDNGLFGLTDNYTIYVPDAVRTIQANELIVALEGNQITLPRNRSCRPAFEALEWHRRHVVIW